MEFIKHFALITYVVDRFTDKTRLQPLFIFYPKQYHFDL